MMKRILLLALLIAPSAGCWDFTEPDFPGAGAPAVFQVNVTMQESGSGNLSGLLVPGLLLSGFEREVPNDSLVVNGLRLPPANIRPNGTREYQYNGVLGDSAAGTVGVLQFAVPQVEETLSFPQEVRWYAVRKIGPDTIAWRPGTDLVLQLDTALGSPHPFPQVRQWFLDIRGTNRSFRLSSDGLPPATLAIPPEFIPEVTGETFTVSLLFYQTGQYRSQANDYATNITFNMSVQWTVEIINDE